MGFVVAGQAAVGGEPDQGPHDPAAGVHDEASLVSGFADDLQGGAQQVPGPVHQAAGEAGVGDDVPDRGGRVGSEQGSFGAVAVLSGGGQDPDGDQQAEGVGDDEPLAAVDLLAGVVAAGGAGHGVRALDALRVDDPRRRLRLRAMRQAHLLAQLGQDPLGHTPSFSRLKCAYTACA